MTTASSSWLLETFSAFKTAFVWFFKSEVESEKTKDDNLHQLKVILTEQGIDATVLFKEAGIDLPENSEKQQSNVLEVKQSDVPDASKFS